MEKTKTKTKTNFFTNFFFLQSHLHGSGKRAFRETLNAQKEKQENKERKKK
jgi:hypothetical protein